ncbi:MAG: TetR/AcrR family transcriptional regulator [Planctomycetes bacterium]|nr:TetR/AcrR family transcriptional regulator [Planctomycetota bacterium]
MSPRAVDPAQVPRRILEQTRHLLVRDGWAALSMRKVAARVGCTATNLYRHFASKDALVHALIDEGMAELHGRLAVAVADGGSPDERLECLCRAYLSFARTNREYYEIMFMLHPERMERYPPESYRRARRNLELIEDVLADGRGVARDDARLPAAATAVWSALHGAASLQLAFRVDHSIDHAALEDELVALALTALHPASP